MLLSHVTFEQRRAAGVYKGGGWEYNDQHINEATSKSQTLLNTNAIVEALNRGVITIGLASTVNVESGEIENPIVELLEQIALGECSEEARAAFDNVNPKLANAGAMDERLAKLMKNHPADVDVAVAATILAFLRDDIEAAEERLEVVASHAGADHKAGAADVNLYLVAEYARKHEETADIGDRLAKRAAESGRQMSDAWKQFFKSELQSMASQD